VILSVLPIVASNGVRVSSKGVRVSSKGGSVSRKVVTGCEITLTIAQDLYQ
jgi:hypothetical protein